ncbi:MAG: iron-sulfur cluster assembly accessory protein [Calothrix sp. C42_A2020_038]|nr:iron-sulfur cluster assembly accessory protein [Calothrix sp. C42_A2020_038]
MIHLSPAATHEIKRLQSKQLQPNLWFRVSVKQGGCSGWFYDMSFEQAPNQNDITLDIHGVRVAIDAQTWGYIDGLKLDYSEDLMGGGFRFHNPQAISCCSCGNSFSL